MLFSDLFDYRSAQLQPSLAKLMTCGLALDRPDNALNRFSENQSFR